MADITTDTLLDHLLDGFQWTTADVRAAIFEAGTWVPAKSDALMLDATGAGAIEMAAASYARVPLVSPIKTLDGGGHRGLLDANVIDFGALETGFDFDTLVIFAFVVDDNDSWILSIHDLGAQTTDGSVIRFVPDTDGIYEITAP